MEQHFLRLSLIIALLFIVGCKKPLTNPESVDPIYIELESIISKTEKQINDDRKALEVAKEDLKKPGLTLGEKRQVLKQISSLDKKIRLHEQDLTFFKIRKKSRLKHVHEIYPRRFEKGLPWPNPDEVATYEVHKKLKYSSRNWADRVPKLKYGPEKAPSKVEDPKDDKNANKTEH